MYWLGRFWLIPTLLLLIGGWWLFNRWQKAEATRELELKAQVVARMWVASAAYYDDPDGYAAYRDSLLDAYQLSGEQLETYTEQFQRTPERLKPFVDRVNGLVDSLVDERMGVPADTAVPDTAAAGTIPANTAAADSL